MSVRIASVVWVQAFMRRCDLAAVPVYVLRRNTLDQIRYFLRSLAERMNAPR